MLFSIKQAAERVGIGEGLLILWISTGKVKPSLELPDAFGTEGVTDDLARRALASYAPDGRVLGWNRFLFTDADIDQLRAMVESTAKQRTKAESAHVKGTDYTVQELAALWNIGVDKIRELFADETGVKKLKSPPKRGKRPYVTLRIPEAVADRVQRKIS